MKYVLLSADNCPSVYLVPDAVADDLRSYCINFCDKWLRRSPHAKKFRRNGCVCYNETDFIEYLNTWVFPEEKSVFIETLDCIEFQEDIPQKLPQKYMECEWFNF